MRRFWAHIIIAFTALVSMVSTFAIIGSRTTGNIEYLEGKEMIFRVSSKDEEGQILENSATDDIIKVMEERLKKSDISYYAIEKADAPSETDRSESYIKVKLRSDSGDISYTQIAFYLTFNGSLALSDNSVDYALFKDFISDEAYYEAYNGFYPSIVIPIDNTTGGTFDTLFTTAKKNGTPEEHEHEEGEEQEETPAIYLYTWYDFNPEVDSYNKTVQTLDNGEANPEYDENVAKKLLNISFKVTDDECFYPDGEKDKLFAVLNIGQSAGEGEEATITMDDARTGFATARYIVNLLNAEELSYKVEAVNSYDLKIASPLVENIKTSDQTLAWSRTLIATVVAILILSLLIAVFYKMSAISICSTSLMTVFLSFLILVSIGAEFNTAAVLGLVLVALASLACGVLYANKLKEESYRGRTLKKANQEAARKTLFPMMDINLVIIVIGGFIYLFGGILFRSFGLVTIIGGLLSFLFNALGLKGMMWLSTNTTAFIGKYRYFGVDETKIANHLEGEQQKYYGPYQDKDFTKKKKPVAIVSGILLLAAMVGMITFGSLNSGALFNQGNTTTTSEVYFMSNSRNVEDNPYGATKVSEILKTTYVYETDPSKAKALSEYVTNFTNNFESSVTEFTYVSKPDNSEGQAEISINYFYYIVRLNSALNGDKLLAYTGTAPVPSGTSVTQASLNEVLTTVTEGLSETGSSYVYLDTTIVSAIPSWSMICLGTFVATAVLCVYFLLRYRLSRGLASIILPFVSCATVLGFFSLIRVVTTNYIAAGLPVVAAFTLIITIIYMSKEKEMVAEDKSRDLSWQNREVIMKKCNSIAFTPILVFTILAAYLTINFFGFGAANCAIVFLITILGILFSALLVTSLYGPISALFYKWFEKLAIAYNKPSNKPNKKNKKVHKSAEPEEAVFIGIND